MTKGSKKKNNTNVTQSEIKTKWDDLDIEALNSEIMRLEQEKEHAFHERIKVQTEHDAVLKYYSIACNNKTHQQERLQLERFQQDELLREQNAEVQVYLDKLESLKYDFECKIENVQQALQTSRENEVMAHHSQIQKKENLVIDLKQLLSNKKVEYMKEIQRIRNHFEKKVVQLRTKLSAELETFKESCASREQQLIEDLDLKRRRNLSVSVEQHNVHLAEIAKKHQELSDSTRAYWEERSNEKKTQIAKLKEESHKLDMAFRDNEMVIEVLENESHQLSEPLSELTSKVEELKHYLKDEEKVRRSLASTKAYIILIDERINQQEKANERLKYDSIVAKQEIDSCTTNLKCIVDQINSPSYSSTEAIQDSFTTALKKNAYDVRETHEKFQNKPIGLMS